MANKIVQTHTWLFLFFPTKKIETKKHNTDRKPKTKQKTKSKCFYFRWFSYKDFIHKRNKKDEVKTKNYL